VLLHLLRGTPRNKAAALPLSIEASAKEATVWIYDFIGYDPWTGTGVSAADFAKEVSAITAPVIRVRINSPGGSVFDGRAIHAALKAHPAHVIASIEGVAASAATFIALAADEVQMARGSLFMIHNAHTLAVGNAEELRSTAALLEKVDGTLVADYVAKTGATEEQVRAWMAAETWFSEEEALAAGFIDTITDGTVTTHWDLSAYAKAPASPAAVAAPALPAVAAAPAAPAAALPEAGDPLAWEEAVRRLRTYEDAAPVRISA
jgi:ATP-dependent Clp protease protease subunit